MGPQPLKTGSIYSLSRIERIYSLEYKVGGTLHLLKSEMRYFDLRWEPGPIRIPTMVDLYPSNVHGGIMNDSLSSSSKTRTKVSLKFKHIDIEGLSVHNYLLSEGDQDAMLGKTGVTTFSPGFTARVIPVNIKTNHSIFCIFKT